MLNILLKLKYPGYKFIYSPTNDELFNSRYDVYFKDLLYGCFGLNLPKQGTWGSSKVLCDKNVGSYYKKCNNEEFHQIAHYCVHAYGLEGVIYNWDALLHGISKLTFVKQKHTTPWNTDDYYDCYYCVNKKQLKSWFKRNHNRFLCPAKLVDHKYQEELY